MSIIDERIRDALDDDDRAFLDSLDKQNGIFRQIGDSWHGPLGGWAKFAFAISIAMGLALAYAFFRAFTADSTDSMLGWGMTTIGLLVMQGFLKEWMFARVNMLMLLKELKRLQLQLAELAGKTS